MLSAHSNRSGERVFPLKKGSNRTFIPATLRSSTSAGTQDPWSRSRNSVRRTHSTRKKRLFSSPGRGTDPGFSFLPFKNTDKHPADADNAL